MACDLATLQAAACTSGISKQDNPIILLQWIAQLTCEASESAAGADWMQGYAANYGGVAPTATPTTDLAAAVDTSNKTLWFWFSSAWHFSGVTLP